MSTQAPAARKPAFYAPRLKSGKAADYLGVSVRHLCDLARRGEIPYYRIGPRLNVFERSDLDAFLAAHRIESD